MSVNYYDEALLKKLKNWVKDPNMTITGPNETQRLLRQYADLNDDKPVTLPLISLRRTRDIRIIDTNKKPLTFEGVTVAVNEERGVQLRAIPIEIRYQIDIYCRYQEEADAYLRDFVFNLINYPKINIEIPYNNLKGIHSSSLVIDETINDNSDIPERLVEGQFTRYTIGLLIPDAWLFSSRAQSNVKLDDIEVKVTFKENIDA